MTSPTDRIAEVLRETEPILQQKSQTCLDCRHGKPGDHAAHVAEQITAELQLTEERWHPESPAGRCRWVTPWASAWSAAEEKP